jgi:nicotinamide-nucleotide amidase
MRLELKRNADIAAQLYARFAARRIKMPDNNLRQADVIAGAEWLPNAEGSAPGQWLQTHHEGRPRILALLPGPPVELKPMFEAEVLPRLQRAVPVQHIATKVLKLAMLPESEADKRASPIYMKHFPEVQTTILAAPGEVQLHLRARAESLATAQARVEKLAEELEDEFDETVFSTSGESLEQIAGYFLDMRGATVAVAESCTGGMLAQRITSVSGSSRWFVGGAVAYSNDLKTMFADVPAALLEEHGAVSKEVAAAMAEGIRKKCKATLGVAITGVAGPTGGTPEKPVGLVFVAVADGHGKPEVKQRNWPASRELIRWWSTQLALDMVRRKLM